MNSSINDFGGQTQTCFFQDKAYFLMFTKNHIIQMRHKPSGADANLKKTKQRIHMLVSGAAPNTFTPNVLFC
jgi:hypothetical protein